MRSLVFVVPGRIDIRTGGSIYNNRIIEGLRQSGWSVGVRMLDESFPYPTTDALDHAARVLSEMPSNTLVIVDGLALSAMPVVIERETSRLRVVALVHLPIAADVGLDRETATRLWEIERRALNAVALIVVTGSAALPYVFKYGISRDRVVVVEPGTVRAQVARGSGGSQLQLLSVATLNPTKGHEILLQALAAVSHSGWHLTCAGSLTRHPETVDRIRTAMCHLGLETRVSLVGELDARRLSECYDATDIFVLATLQETYGMAVAEALAHGLPVVSTTTGAIPDLVGNDAGLLVPPGDTAALTEALIRIISNAGLRARLSAGARHTRKRLANWNQACAKMTAALDRLGIHG